MPSKFHCLNSTTGEILQNRSATDAIWHVIRPCTTPPLVPLISSRFLDVFEILSHVRPAELSPQINIGLSSCDSHIAPHHLHKRSNSLPYNFSTQSIRRDAQVALEFRLMSWRLELMYDVTSTRQDQGHERWSSWDVVGIWLTHLFVIVFKISGSLLESPSLQKWLHNFKAPRIARR